jgi:hypothetical protein
MPKILHNGYHFFGETEKYDIESENYDQNTEEMVVSKQSVDMKERFDTHFMKSISYILTGEAKKGFTH